MRVILQIIGSPLLWREAKLLGPPPLAGGQLPVPVEGRKTVNFSVADVNFGNFPRLSLRTPEEFTEKNAAQCGFHQ